MDLTLIGEWIKEGGGWGVAAVFAYLYWGAKKDLKEEVKAHIEDIKTITKEAVDRVEKMSEANVVSMDKLKEVVTAIKYLIESRK